MTTIVRDDTELPPDGFHVDYIRCLTDPTLLVASRSGEIFRREDGARWEWPGYEVNAERRDELSPWIAKERKPCSAYEDSARYVGSSRLDAPLAVQKKLKKAS